MKPITRLVNQFLTTPTDDAKLDGRLANASSQEWGNVISGLAQAFDRKLADTIKTNIGWVADFMRNGGTLTSISNIFEANLGNHYDYDINSKFKTDMEPQYVLETTYAIAYKKKWVITMAQTSFKQAFANGGTFEAFISDTMKKVLTDTPTRFERQVLGKWILDQFKNEISLDVVMAGADLDPANETDMLNLAKGLILKLTEGQTPSCLFEIGYTQASLSTMNGKYHADTDTYDASFDRTKHAINSFDLSEVKLVVAPKVKEGLSMALANIYHENKLDASQRFAKIEASPLITDLKKVYMVKDGTIFIEMPLDVMASDNWAGNLGVDTFRHRWYKPAVKPWGIGCLVSVKKHA